MRLVRNNESSSQPIQAVLVEGLSKPFNQTGENVEQVRAAFSPAFPDESQALIGRVDDGRND